MKLFKKRNPHSPSLRKSTKVRLPSPLSHVTDAQINSVSGGGTHTKAGFFLCFQFVLFLYLVNSQVILLRSQQ